METKKPSTYVSQYAIYLVWTLLVKKGKANFFLYSRDATTKKRANESRKLPLRFDNRCHESVDPLFRLA